MRSRFDQDVYDALQETIAEYARSPYGREELDHLAHDDQTEQRFARDLTTNLARRLRRRGIRVAARTARRKRC